MTGEIDNLILEQLRGIRGDIGLLRNEVRDLKERVGRLETVVNGLRRDILNLAETDAAIQVHIDRLGDRVERIETRLGLVDSPPLSS